MQIKSLSNGLSGAGVDLYLNEKQLYVKKYVLTTSGASTLIEQAEIMRSWNNYLIRVPYIIDSGSNANYPFYIDMEYIEGDTLCHSFSNPNIKNSRDHNLYRKILVQYMLELIEHSHSSTESNLYDLALSKLKLITSNIKSRETSEKDYFNLHLVSIVESHFHKHRNTIKLLSSNSKHNSVHGDLTLSNVIVAKGDMIFIDPIHHYLGNNIFADYFKLIFDLEFGLSFKVERNFAPIKTSISLYMLKVNHALKQIFTDRFMFLSEVEHLFIIVEALRVLQYQDSQTKLATSLSCYIESKLRRNDA